MKITISSTTKITELLTPRGAVQARLWEGTTENGIPVFCFVTRIAPAILEHELTPEQLAEFERDLQDCAKPTPVASAIPARMIL